MTVEAYGVDGKLLVSGVYGSFFDDVYTGTTEEDRFFGIAAMGDELIKRVFVGINSPATGMELDHVRFAKATVIPEPSSCGLAMCAVVGLYPLRRRRRTSNR